MVTEDEMRLSMQRQRDRLMAEYALPEGSIVVSGERSVAYRALESASKRALEAQTAHVEAKAELHRAIEELCRAMTPMAADVPERKPWAARGDE